MPLALTDDDRALLEGKAGEGARFAMRIVVRLAEARGAERLIDIASAHIDGCLYHGPAGLDFVDRLLEGSARVRVPTSLNVGSLDLLHPDLNRGGEEEREAARRLMRSYESLGCRPTWTCAPYQVGERPAFGEHVAWAESNAIAFANSVLGARTDRYGDFIDIAAAVTGRAPDAGLHRTENRRGEVVFRLRDIPAALLQEDAFYPILGYLIGRRTGARVPVVDGLTAVSEDRLKALGAAAASSGSVGLFHVVGVTPEAPTLEAALAGRAPVEDVEVTVADLVRARDALTTTADAPLAAVSLGTPHYSLDELGRLAHFLEGERVHPDVRLYVSTGREVLAEAETRGWADALREAGARILTDTCTYVAPIMGRVEGTVMTDSAKWAHYAPGNLGVDVVFGSAQECARSAVDGSIRRDPTLWTAA